MTRFWNCISTPSEEYLSELFEKLGRLIFDRALIFFVSGIVLSILMGFGLFNTQISNDIVELYTPQSTSIYNEYITRNKLFDSSLSSSLILILKGNIFTTKGLNEAYSAWNSIYTLKAEVENENYTFFNQSDSSHTLCKKIYPSSPICISCLNNYFYLVFKNETTSEIDPNLWQNTSFINDDIYNGDNGDKIKLFIGDSGNSLLLQYVLTSYDDNSDNAKTAKHIFIDNWLSYWQKHKNDYTQFNVYYFTGYSFETETNRMLNNNVNLLFISIILLFIYIMIIYGKLNMVYTRPWLAFGGIISILFSVIAGFGTASAAGYPFTVCIFLLPFIVFGIGIDVMIITVDTFNNIPLGDNDKQRFGLLLKQIGYLITISALTTILSFSFGCVVQMTGVRTFCVFALCCFMWNYLNFWLIFLPLMVWDNKRIANNKNGVIYCIEAHTNSKQEKRLPLISRLIKLTLINILNNRIGRWIIIILFMIFVILSGTSISDINTTSDPTNFLSSDSYIIDFYNIYNREFNGISPREIEIIIENVDFSDSSVRNKFDDMFVEFNNSTYKITDIQEWLTEFEAFINIETIETISSDQFYLTLKTWTNRTSDVYIIYDDINNPTKVRATRFFALIFEERGDVYSQLAIRDEYMDIVQGYDLGSGSNVFVYNFEWTLKYFDTVVLSYTEAIMIFTGIGIFFVLWIFIDWRILLIILINLIMIDINLYGWIYGTDIILDSITFIQCLMSIGFTIDYIMYIAYTISVHLWNNKSLIDNDISNIEEILVIITSICRSSFTTWIAVLPLLFADNHGFKQFYIMFTGIICIALFQSVFFTTALCVELNVLFKSCTYCNDSVSVQSDIKNLTTNVAMHQIEQKRKGQPTPDVELGSNIDIITNGGDHEDIRKMSIGICDCQPIPPIPRTKQQPQPMTPDEELRVKPDIGTNIVYNNT